MTPAAIMPIEPGWDAPPGLSCAPMCGAAAWSRHGVTPAAGGDETSCLNPLAQNNSKYC